MRRTFANTIRRDLKVVQYRGRTQVSGGGLTYSTKRRNADTAAAINSRIPIAIINPPFQP